MLKFSDILMFLIGFCSLSMWKYEYFAGVSQKRMKLFN